MEEFHTGHRRQRVSLKAPARPHRRAELSSHSFKLLPNIGKHVVELLEGSLSQELAEAWRWRPGGDALRSRRAAPAKDLADMPGWCHDGAVTADGVEEVSQSMAEVNLKAQL